MSYQLNFNTLNSQQQESIVQQLLQGNTVTAPNGLKLKVTDGDTIKLYDQKGNSLGGYATDKKTGQQYPAGIRLSGGDAYEVSHGNWQEGRHTSDAHNQLGKLATEVMARSLVTDPKVSIDLSNDKTHDRSVGTVNTSTGNAMDRLLNSQLAIPYYKYAGSDAEQARQHQYYKGMNHGEADYYSNANFKYDAGEHKGDTGLSPMAKQLLGAKQEQIKANVTSRNPEMSAIDDAITNLKNQIAYRNSQPAYTQPQYDADAKINPFTMKPMTKAEEQEFNKNKEYYNSNDSYTMGFKQLANKAASEGLLSYVLPKDTVDAAKQAYIDNEKFLAEGRRFNELSGNWKSNLAHTVANTAPDIAVELGLAATGAGVIGKAAQGIGMAEKLLNSGLKGKAALEAIKWGGAEVPTSYALGEQEHLGQRVALGALGGAVPEVAIAGGKKLIGKGKELNEKLKADKVAKDIAREKELTPEPVEINPETATTKANQSEYYKDGIKPEEYPEDYFSPKPTSPEASTMKNIEPTEQSVPKESIVENKPTTEPINGNPKESNIGLQRELSDEEIEYLKYASTYSKDTKAKVDSIKARQALDDGSEEQIAKDINNDKFASNNDDSSFAPSLTKQQAKDILEGKVSDENLLSKMKDDVEHLYGNNKAKPYEPKNEEVINGVDKGFNKNIKETGYKTEGLDTHTDVKDMLKSISKDTTKGNETYAEVAKVLFNKKSLDGVNITHNADGSAAIVTKDGKTINLAKGYTNRDVLHEAAHHLTNNFIELGSRGRLAEAQQKAFERLNNIYSNSKKLDTLIGSKFEGQFKDLHEFVSEAYSNREFQEFLKSLKTDSKQTVWSKVVENLSKLLGVKNNNALGEVIDITSFHADRYGKHYIGDMQRNLPSVKDINGIVKDGADTAMDLVKAGMKKLGESKLGQSAKDTVSAVGSKLDDVTHPAISNPIKKPFEGETLSGAMKEFTRNIDDTKEATQYRELNNIRSQSQQEQVEYAHRVRELGREAIKDVDKKETEQFVKTYIAKDYTSIKDLGLNSVEDGNKWLASNSTIIKPFEKYINQMSKALSDKGYQNSDKFFDNAHILTQTRNYTTKALEKKGYTREQIEDVIDKAVSVKAMNKQDFEFLAKNKDSEWFKLFEQARDEDVRLSKEYFKDTPHQYMKGYYKETRSDSIWNYKPTENGGVDKYLASFDAPAREKGALILNPEKKAMGMQTKREDIPDDKLHTYKVTRDAEGKPTGYHRLADEAQRLKMEKNYDPIETLAQTRNSITEKMGARKQAEWFEKNIDNEFFSKEAKEGFVPLKEDLKNMLPKEMRNNVGDYVSKDMEHYLFGNEQLGYFKDPNSMGKKIWNTIFTGIDDAGGHFKQSVIMANLRPYFTNYISGITSLLRQGANLKEIHSLYRESLKLNDSMERDLAILNKLKMTGKDTSKAEAALENNELYQMKKAGLAMTMVKRFEGLTDKKSFSKNAFETITDKVYAKMGTPDDRKLAGRHLSEAIRLEPNTKAGNYAGNIMSRIDLTARYATAKHLMQSKGMSMEEAVAHSNALFGDSNKINPKLVQFIDKATIMPFASWAFKVSGGNLKYNKDNAVQAFSIYLAMNKLGAVSGLNLNSGDATQIPKTMYDSANRFQSGKYLSNLNPVHTPTYLKQVGHGVKTLLEN